MVEPSALADRITEAVPMDGKSLIVAMTWA
jgi:hypothetical protein